MRTMLGRAFSGTSADAVETAANRTAAEQHSILKTLFTIFPHDHLAIRPHALPCRAMPRRAAPGLALPSRATLIKMSVSTIVYAT